MWGVFYNRYVMGASLFWLIGQSYVHRKDRYILILLSSSGRYVGSIVKENIGWAIFDSRPAILRMGSFSSYFLCSIRHILLSLSPFLSLSLSLSLFLFPELFLPASSGNSPFFDPVAKIVCWERGRNAVLIIL